MKVLFKKRATTITVKAGVAWPFFFALICPLIGVLACLRRRLFWQAASIVGYIAAQTHLQRGDAVWTGLIDMFPAPERFANNDAYMTALILWLVYGAFAARYAFDGNRLTAKTLFQRGYVCPIEAHAVFAEATWSLSKISARMMQNKVEGIHKSSVVE